ncbi:aspartate/glutamate racemase family protein [Desulfosporosinus sp. PR]|uniref:maleate cis-trans isomerase family protein n=1 Tax=Candidatus Desulfosporosinus nitrosoreducens TaxID=3401928 RepID=UPI0027FAA7C0|nr:aspartate/glutamate racemase family protein [Desulfosporosinus sp. PR]MDQ7094375.1 aspartate/glutamate racemase family protein [Desulfosporosinus sp. PR]
MPKTMFDPTEQKKIGMLTPSSNTALEPICSRMVSGLEDQVTMHYSRLVVTKISLEKEALSQFDLDPFLRAAELLAHADVDAIAWNGTSGGWVGFEFDRMLCEKITEATGIPAITSMLAMLDAFKENNVQKLHMVTPYIPSIDELIAKQYEKCGYQVINVRGLNQTINRSFALITPEQINQLCKEVSVAPADGISIICTNLRSTWQVEQLERAYGITVYDSTAVTVWKTLKMVGIDPNIIEGWGKLFAAK